jgi:hypothetical protein
MVREARRTDAVQWLREAPIIAFCSMATGARIDIAMASIERPVGLQPWKVFEHGGGGAS